MKNKLHLPGIDIVLLYDVPEINADVKGVREVEVKVLSKERFITMLIDERFNEIDFIYSDVLDVLDDPFKYSNKISEYLKEKYEELKSTDFRYKRDGETTFDYGLVKRTIYLEDFISFLKKENRNQIIDGLLD